MPVSNTISWTSQLVVEPGCIKHNLLHAHCGMSLQKQLMSLLCFKSHFLIPTKLSTSRPPKPSSRLFLHRENGQISNPISIITYVPKIPTLLSTIPPPLFERGISGQDLKPRKGKGEQGIWNTWAKPRDLVIKRVTLQTGKGLQRERIRDELLEWVQFVPSFCPSVVR